MSDHALFPDETGDGRVGLDDPSHLMARFGHKIVDVTTLCAKIGDRPRERTVIMCHGVFDIIHPGHLRHLMYAKSKADLVVASLTADRHIDKDKYRPHVPQNLRALNLAVLEIVDYVLIDPNPTPIKNLLQIKPDYFAKGYEYTSKDLPPKTREEKDSVESYGGEVLFTPGDIVYSSSALIDLAPPSLQIEKLLVAMETEGFEFNDLRQILTKFAGKSVHVVGDIIIDSYSNCVMIGGQTKTPTMSVLFQDRTDYVGGAGIVAKHLKSAGASVKISTVIGDDDLGRWAVEDLEQHGIEVNAIFDPTRPTTNKNAIVVGNYRLLKVDTLDNSSISDSVLDKVCAAIRDTACDAVAYCDFRHGLFNRRTIPALVNAIPPDCFTVADSQVASRWGNICDFRGFDLITPNEREARFALADQDSGIRPLASQLYDQSECKTLIMKLGERGVLTCRNSDHESLNSFFVVDSFVDTVVDAVGAGDALLAYATLSMLACGNEFVATVIGSLAAASECEVDGNIPISPSQVLAKLDAIEKQVNFSAV